MPVAGHDGGMASSRADPARSVKIGADERTGWSSDRPRRDGAPRAPADLTVALPRARAGRTACATRPGSLLIVASASAAERDALPRRA